MYDWQGKRVPAEELEKTWESVKEPWEVFSILPAADDSGTLSADFFLIVVRRPKSA
jgi:hypothetical protein